MAYAITHYRVVVRGTMAGGEVWANTWGAIDAAGGQDPTDLGPFFHDLYAGMATSRSTSWSATQATVKNLSTLVVNQLPFAATPGEIGGDCLPTECALRVSLDDGDGRRGGPFLSGFAAGDLATDGTYVTNEQGDLVALLQDFVSDMETSDWKLGLDSPTGATMVPVANVRVGVVFDVIRRRRNDLPENFAGFSITP